MLGGMRARSSGTAVRLGPHLLPSQIASLCCLVKQGAACRLCAAFLKLMGFLVLSRRVIRSFTLCPNC